MNQKESPDSDWGLPTAEETRQEAEVKRREPEPVPGSSRKYQKIRHFLQIRVSAFYNARAFFRNPESFPKQSQAE